MTSQGMVRRGTGERRDRSRCPLPLDPEEEWLIEYPSIEVFEEENPVVATFVALDGEPLIEITERRHVPFGYQKG